MTKHTADAPRQQNGGKNFLIPMPQFEGIPKEFQTFVELGTKLQSEFVTLWGHRTRAWMDWPAKMMTCKSSTDLFQAQSEFANAMQYDYAAYWDRVFRDALIEKEELEETPAQTETESGLRSIGGKREAA